MVTLLPHAAPSLAQASAPDEEAQGCPALPKPSILSGNKFAADGRPLYFPGCTIICHVALFTPLSKLLIGIRDEFKRQPYAHKLAFLPPSSYHMTVFEGDSPGRRKPLGWFQGVALNASRADVARHVAERLRAFDLDCQLPLKLRVNAARPYSVGIPLVPADDREETKLRRLRNRLADHLQFRLPTHGAYQFHITLAYLLQPLSSDEAAMHRVLVNEFLGQLSRDLPVLELGAPEFCLFQDMFAFDGQFQLRGVSAA